MRQILLNLVSNAIKFTSTGKVHVLMEIVERAGARCMIHCMVRDTGIGMESHQVATCFRRLPRPMPPPPAKFGGTGLGLAICKELTEAMGGIIGAKSWPGTGSEFSIRIPLLIQDDSEVAPALLPLRVLLVEDSDGGRKTLHSQLSHLGCSVESVGSEMLRAQLQHAVDHNQPFQLLLLDHQANQATLGQVLVQIRSDTSFMNLKSF